MLLSRVGQKKQRLWPWFKPPVAGPTVRYVGWYWDPANKEWLPTPVEKIKVVYVSQLYPKPTQLPSREFSSSQPGWGYDFITNKWVKTYVEAVPIEFTPPRTLSPEITEEAVIWVGPIEREWVYFLTKMIEAGFNPTEAKRVADSMRKYYWAIARAAKTQTNTRAWQDWVHRMDGSLDQTLNNIGAVALMGTVAALTGWLIGSIAERLTFPDVDVFTLKEPKGTYLLRYDHYLYGKMIGISPKGKPFYSACDDIGTSYIRHRKAPKKGGVDIIDFPGGFVEEGHKGAYFVKYTWRAWTLEYIGFLTNVGGNFYVLREGNTDSYAWGKAPFMLHESEWCPDFRWYL